MACETITAGRIKACKNKQGGLFTLYIYEWVNESMILAGETMAVTGIKDPFPDVYQFEIEGDVNTFVAEKVSDRNTGATVVTQTLTFSLKGIDKATSAVVNALSQGYYCAVISDRNGVNHCGGLDDGFDFTVTEVTGGAKTDMNGYNIVGTATTKLLPPKIDSTQFTTFLTKVVEPA